MRWRCQNYCWNRGGGSPCQWHLVLFILYWTNHKLLCCIVCRICEVLTHCATKWRGTGTKWRGTGTKWRGTAQNDGGHRHSAVKTSHITYYGIVNFESYEVFIGGMYTYTYAFPKFLTVITATTLDICHVKYSLTLIGEKYFNIQLVITIYGTIL